MGVTCCLLVDESTADEDAEMFDCEACPLAEQLAGLDPINTRVWGIYRQLVTRLAGDLYAGGTVLERLTREMSPDDFAEIWRRLVMLYDTIQPPPKGPNG